MPDELVVGRVKGAMCGKNTGITATQHNSKQSPITPLNLVPHRKIAEENLHTPKTYTHTAMLEEP